MSRSKLIVLLSTATAAVVAISLVSFLMARGQFQDQSSTQPTATLAATDVLNVAHVTFRNAALGSEYGVLAAVPLADPKGPRAYFGISCERQYSNRTGGVCLRADRGVVTSSALVTLDSSLKELRQEPLNGNPSRTRMSPDGTLVATTTFVSGHSYADTSFVTEAIVRQGGQSLGNLEQWNASVDGRPLLAASRNYWGGTFASDDDTFYVTGAVGQTTWLMKGSVSKRTLTSMRTDAECPALSPDGTKLGYKKRLGNSTPGVWRFAVLDLTTDTETVLAETRHVDDQLEWLDNDHVLYQLPRSGVDATVTDIWSVPTDGSGAPELFIPEASSPAVVR